HPRRALRRAPRRDLSSRRLPPTRVRAVRCARECRRRGPAFRAPHRRPAPARPRQYQAEARAWRRASSRRTDSRLPGQRVLTERRAPRCVEGTMTTLRFLLAGMLLGTMLGGPVAAAERDPRGLAQALAKRLTARRTAPPAIHATDFQGTDIGCIILQRFELRPYGYPGHAFLCEVAGTGEVLGAVLARSG